MCPDLQSLLEDWSATSARRPARVVTLAGGQPFVQLRIECGLLQMHPDGRPDGAVYQGCPSALDFVERRRAAGQPIDEPAWNELYRELRQFNYRRVALMELDALDGAPQPSAADRIQTPWLDRALRDTDHCLRILAVFAETDRLDATQDSSLRVSLVMNRARLAARRHELHGDPDAAVESVEDGLTALRNLADAPDESVERIDFRPALQYLAQLSRRLRRRYAIDRTLREQLADAVASEDFELAARLRDELARRGRSDRSAPPGTGCVAPTPDSNE